MLRRNAPARAFTLIELLVVIAIICLLLGLSAVGIVNVWVAQKNKASDTQMRLIEIALEAYREEFNDYPPDTTAGNPPVAVDGTNNGSEILAYYLYTRLRRGDHTCGPYLQKCEQFIRPGANGLSALYSPWNGRYVYANITGPHTAGRPRVVVIDPGRDRQLGGVIDPQAGFVPNGTDANGDGAPDHKDNFKNNSL